MYVDFAARENMGPKRPQKFWVKNGNFLGPDFYRRVPLEHLKEEPRALCPKKKR